MEHIKNIINKKFPTIVIIDLEGTIHHYKDIVWFGTRAGADTRGVSFPIDMGIAGEKRILVQTLSEVTAIRELLLSLLDSGSNLRVGATGILITPNAIPTKLAEVTTITEGVPIELVDKKTSKKESETQRLLKKEITKRVKEAKALLAKLEKEMKKDEPRNNRKNNK